jgi:MFS family permease
LLLILASVALWYIGYNSITSKYSVYATNVLHFDFNFTLIIAQAAAIVSYIPVGNIACKIGRRKTILAGVIILASAFFIGNFITAETPELVMYPVFILAGIGWATINVNSFPMVVELAKGGDIGKYTGYYYTASMSAQIVAPILSGLLYDLFTMRVMFFAFGTLFVALSFVTMFFVKHGDAKPIQKKDALEALDVD